VCIPFVCGKERGDMKMMPLINMEELQSFNLTKWNIPEPERELVESREDMTTSGDLDLILLPGCVFDRKANRLGHGKGYYDTFLAKVFQANQEKGKARPVLVGLSLDEQLLPEGEEVPIDGHDVKLDFIVSPSCIICGSSS